MMAVSVPAIEDKASFTREIQTQAVGQIRGDPEKRSRSGLSGLGGGVGDFALGLRSLQPRLSQDGPSALNARLDVSRRDDEQGRLRSRHAVWRMASSRGLTLAEAGDYHRPPMSYAN